MEDMKKKNQKKQIIRVLSESVQKIIEQERMDFSELQEIRLRIGQPVTVLYQNEELILPTMYSEKKRLGKQEMKETIEHISNYSLYAYEHELKQGFITIEGGHRVHTDVFEISVISNSSGCRGKVSRFSYFGVG